MLKLPHGGQAKQALDVLLITLARAELTLDDDQAEMWYEAQRERDWSTFLSDAYRSLQQSLSPVNEGNGGRVPTMTCGQMTAKSATPPDVKGGPPPAFVISSLSGPHHGLLGWP